MRQGRCHCAAPEPLLPRHRQVKGSGDGPQRDQHERTGFQGMVPHFRENALEAGETEPGDVGVPHGVPKLSVC